MQIFLINLDRRPDRLERMSKRLDGLDYTRIPAVDGASIPSTDTLSGPAIGCSMSHAEAWKMLIRSGQKWACILEDDVILSRDFGTMMSDETWLPDEFDLIKFESMNRSVEIGSTPASAHNRYISRLYSPHMGTGGYIISTDAASRLLGPALSFKDTIDGTLFGKKAVAFMKVFQVFPALCIQEQYVYGHNNDSSIAPGNSVRWRKPKPRGWAKVIREISRPFTAGFYARQNPFIRRTRMIVDFSG